MEAATRLYLDDLATSVRANVARRGDRELVLSQDLPFLKLNSSVRDADGRQAELASVYLAVHGDTPRLMLELRYPEPEPAPAPSAQLRRARRDETVPYMPLGRSSAPPRRDSTIPYAPEDPSSFGRLSTLPGLESSIVVPTIDTAEEDATLVFRHEDALRETVAPPALALASRPRQMTLGAFLTNAWRTFLIRAVRALAMLY